MINEIGILKRPVSLFGTMDAIMTIQIPQFIFML
jgi:hypothetical protein